MLIGIETDKTLKMGCFKCNAVTLDKKYKMDIGTIYASHVLMSVEKLSGSTPRRMITT